MWINKFLQKQQQMMINEYKNHMTTCLISATPKKILQLSKQYKWNISSLKNVKKTSAIIITKQSGNSELWVSRKYTDYRSAFYKYLKHTYDFSDIKIPTEYQVDHLLPRYRFRTYHSIHFIRLHLIKGAVNASFGAGFEKCFFAKERNIRPKDGIHMDWLAFLKAYGLKLPPKSKGAIEWARWSWIVSKKLKDQGIEEVIVSYHGISTILNLGYTGRYSPLPLPKEFKDEARLLPEINNFPSLSNS